MAHGDARVGNMVYPALLPLMRTSRLRSSRQNWRFSADLNGFVRLSERRNLVSAHVPSHFNWLKKEIWFRRMCHHMSTSWKTKSSFGACAVTFKLAERRNLVSAHVPSNFNWLKHEIWFLHMFRHISTGWKTKFSFCACAVKFQLAEKRNLVSAHVPSHFN